MLITKTAVVLAIIDFTAATTCTVSAAESWPANNDFGTSFGGGNGGDIYGGAQSVSDCSNFCQQDQACVTGCLDLIMAGQCNAVGGKNLFVQVPQTPVNVHAFRLCMRRRDWYRNWDQ